MIRYTVYFNGEQTSVYELDEPVIFIGRLPENQIPITNMGISRRHVKIELDPGGQYVLTDLNSLNGTLLNGKRTKKAILTHGDKITIGKYTIIYEDLRETSPFLDTMVAEISPEELRAMAAAAGHLPVLDGAQQFSPPLPATIPQTSTGAPLGAPVPTARVLPPLPTTIPQTIVGTPTGAPVSPTSETQSCAVLIETASHIKYKLDRTFMTIGSHSEDDIHAPGGSFFGIGSAAVVIEQRTDGSYFVKKQRMVKLKVNGKSVRKKKLTHRDKIEIGASTFRFMENG